MATCEELGFSKEECAALSADDKEALGISGGTAGRGPKPKSVIDSNADLKKVIRNYEETPLLTIINTLQKKGLRLSAGYYQELQKGLLASEKKTGLPFSYLAGAEGAGPTIQNAISAGTLTGSDRNYLAEQQAADAAAMERAQLQAQIDRERIAEDKRQNLLNNARALVESRMGERTKAREQGTQLAGTDPFKLTGSLQGVALGSDIQTPYDIFKTQVGSVATQNIQAPAPNASIQDLESAIQKLSGPSQQPTTMGFQGGGTAGTMGPYEARLVGEAGSQIAPGTEVMVTGASIVPSPGETTILPLQSGAETGGVFPDFSQNQPIDYNSVSLGTLPQNFANLRRSLGVGEGPLTSSSRASLGFGPEGGMPIGQAEFGQGYGALGSPLSLEFGLRDLQKAGQIDEMGVKKLTSLIGFLPNPRNAYTKLRTLSPPEKLAVLSAYRLAGIDEATYQALLESAQIAGPTRQTGGVSLAA